MRPSGWSQIRLLPSSWSETASEAARSLCLSAEEDCLDEGLPRVVLLLSCRWLTSFSSGARFRRGALSSTNSGNSSPGFGKVYWVRPVGL